MAISCLFVVILHPIVVVLSELILICFYFAYFTGILLLSVVILYLFGLILCLFGSILHPTVGSFCASHSLFASAWCYFLSHWNLFSCEVVF